MEAITKAAMNIDYTLGSSCRAGSIDHVGHVARLNRADRILFLPTGLPVAVQADDVYTISWQQVSPAPLCEQNRHLRILDHVGKPFLRIGWI